MLITTSFYFQTLYEDYLQIQIILRNYIKIQSHLTYIIASAKRQDSRILSLLFSHELPLPLLDKRKYRLYIARVRRSKGAVNRVMDNEGN